MLLGLAATVVVHRLSPSPPPVRTVVVAAAALPAGATLATGDLQTVSIPVEAVGEGWAADPETLVGRTLALAVTDGTVLGPPLLVDDTAVGPSGTVVSGVRLAEPALAAVLSPGMHVDLLVATADVDGAPGGEGDEGTVAAPATTLAVRALVLPRPAGADATGGVLGAVGSSTSTDEIVLVAVTPDEASLLANVAGRQAVSAVVVR